jgi:hypothetical protein
MAGKKPEKRQRVPHEETVMVAVRLEKSSHDTLNNLVAMDLDRPTISTLIRRAVREYIERQRKPGVTVGPKDRESHETAKNFT